MRPCSVRLAPPAPSSESLRSLGVIGGSVLRGVLLLEKKETQCLPTSTEPIGIDRKPFESQAIKRAIQKAPHTYKDTLWITDGQLRALNMRLRQGERPVVAARQVWAARKIQADQVKPLKLYNVEQLERPSALRDAPPQTIDGEPIFGFDSIALAGRQPLPRGDGGEAPCTGWFTIPDGLKRAGRRLQPEARVVSLVLGFAEDRRGVSLVSEVQTMHDDGTVPDADLPAVATRPFHRTRGGILFSTATQAELGEIAKRHGYASTTWHNVSGRNQHRLRPNSPTHALSTLPQSFSSVSNVFVNGDNYVDVAADEPMSGWTGAPFSPAVSDRLRFTAQRVGFASNTWIMADEVSRCGIKVRDGQAPTSMSFGDAVRCFFNYDQLADPPAPPLKIKCRRTSTQVSGKTGRPFGVRISEELERAGKVGGFISNAWITANYARLVGCCAKPGAMPTDVAACGAFYNFDQLVDPPRVGAVADGTSR